MTVGAGIRVEMVVPAIPGRFVVVIPGCFVLVMPGRFVLVIPGLDPGIAPTDGARGDPRIKSGDDEAFRADEASRADGAFRAHKESGDDEESGDNGERVVGPAEGCSGCSPFLMLARHAPTMTSTKESR
jgi:hypothetical protein